MYNLKIKMKWNSFVRRFFTKVRNAPQKDQFHLLSLELVSWTLTLIIIQTLQNKMIYKNPE